MNRKRAIASMKKKWMKWTSRRKSKVTMMSFHDD